MTTSKKKSKSSPNTNNNTAEEHIAHFSIDGALIADIAKERFLEGDPNYAYRLLKEGLEGISHEQVFAILRGEKTLVGINDIDYVDATDIPYREKVKQMTTGIYRHKGRLYQPYGYVGAYTENDFSYAVSKGYPQKSERFSKARNEYYCRENEICVEVEEFKGDYAPRNYCIFKEVLLPTGMAKDTLDPNEAFKEYIAKYKLKEFRDDAYVDLMTSTKSHSKQDLEVKDALEDFAHPEENALKDIKEVVELQQDFETYVKNSKEKVLEQVKALGDKWIDLKDREGNFVAKVAYNPFAQWTVERFLRMDRQMFLPEWQTVCKSGLKMINDDPVHSDWMLSGDLDLDDWYRNEQLTEAAYMARSDLMDELFSMEVTTLSSGKGYLFAPVVLVDSPKQKVPKDCIVVLKNASPEFQSQMVQATKGGKGAVIVETGSAVAHLAKVGRESGVLIVKLNDAFKKLHDGDVVAINTNEGKVKIFGYDMDFAVKIEHEKERLKELTTKVKKSALKP